MAYLRDPPADHHLGASDFASGDGSATALPDRPQVTVPLPARPATQSWTQPLVAQGLWSDLQTFSWLREPASSLKMILVVVFGYVAYALAAPRRDNPFASANFISYPLPPRLGDAAAHYDYGRRDVAFLLFYLLVFSFTRQATVEYVLRPLAKYAGLRREAKILRFCEQGYTFLYFSISGSYGIRVMSKLPTWWFRTEHFWLDYPHPMTASMKYYYLLQYAYWLQQMFVLVLKIEKPRSDYAELCVHHCVTLWLITWSYTTYLTLIGNAIFVTMDVSDAVFALAKCFNYIAFQRTSEVLLFVFLCTWTYLRHYLNLKILWSVWTQYGELVPKEARVFDFQRGVFLAPWLRYQIFVPIALLQLVNLFWLYLILRVVIRVLRGAAATDSREADEASDAEEDAAKDD